MAPDARHGVNVNVDFCSGVVNHLLGIKRDLLVPIFAVGGVPGWVVQALGANGYRHPDPSRSRFITAPRPDLMGRSSAGPADRTAATGCN